MKTIKEVKAERDAFWDQSEKDLRAAIEKELPLGSRAAWRHGRHEQTGSVIRYGYGDTVFLRNHATDTEVKKSAFDLTPLGGP